MARLEFGDLNFDRLMEVLHYDPETGIWWWRVDGHKRGVGRIAGSFTTKDIARSRSMVSVTPVTASPFFT